MTDALEQAITAFQAEVEQLERSRARLHQQLKKLLTRANFEDMVPLYLPLIIDPTWPRIDLSCTYLSWKEDDPQSYSIRAYRPLDELVSWVWPHAIMRRTEGGAIIYELVSKTKWLREKRGIVSEIKEDNFCDALGYLIYLLRHNERARQKYLSLPHFAAWYETIAGTVERTGDWHYVADILYDNLLADEIRQEYDRWRTVHRCAMWCNLHDRVLEYAIIFAPLRMTAYELLWVLDLLSPMNFRWYKDCTTYDLNHLKKLRLIERVNDAHQTIRSARQCEQSQSSCLQVSSPNSA